VKGGFINPRLKEHSAYLEDYLSQHDYFAGDFSFADIQMSFPVVAMQERVKAHNPQMVAYAQRIQQRPAFKKAKRAQWFLVGGDDLNLIFCPVHQAIRHSGNLLSNSYRTIQAWSSLIRALVVILMMWMCKVLRLTRLCIESKIQQPSCGRCTIYGRHFCSTSCPTKT
jgi:uncharacterized protein